jgi:hypothetical protein
MLSDTENGTRELLGIAQNQKDTEGSVLIGWALSSLVIFIGGKFTDIRYQTSQS